MVLLLMSVSPLVPVDVGTLAVLAGWLALTIKSCSSACTGQAANIRAQHEKCAHACSHVLLGRWSIVGLLRTCLEAFAQLAAAD